MSFDQSNQLSLHKLESLFLPEELFEKISIFYFLEAIDGSTIQSDFCYYLTGKYMETINNKFIQCFPVL